MKAAFFWIPFVLLYLIVIAAWRRGRALLTLAVTTMAMAVPVSLLAIGEYLTRDVLWNHRLMQANVYSRFFRVNSIFYDPNILGRYLVLALIIIVATFNIASNLLMMSMEKLRDIGVLRAMGASPGFIRRVFFWEGNLIALAGIVLGVVLGVGVSVFIAVYPVIELPADIYYVTKVPVELKVLNIFLTAACSYLLCMASALFPALQAARMSPVDAIRYG